MDSRDSRIPKEASFVATEGSTEIFFDADSAKFCAIVGKRGLLTRRNLSDLKRDIRKANAPVKGLRLHVRNWESREVDGKTEYGLLCSIPVVEEYTNLESGRLRKSDGNLLKDDETFRAYHYDEAAFKRLEELAEAEVQIRVERIRLMNRLQRFRQTDFTPAKEGKEAQHATD